MIIFNIIGISVVTVVVGFVLIEVIKFLLDLLDVTKRKMELRRKQLELDDQEYKIEILLSQAQKFFRLEMYWADLGRLKRIAEVRDKHRAELGKNIKWITSDAIPEQIDDAYFEISNQLRLFDKEIEELVK